MVQSPKQMLGKMSEWRREKKMGPGSYSTRQQCLSLSKGVLIPTCSTEPERLQVMPTYSLLALAETPPERRHHLSLKGLLLKIALSVSHYNFGSESPKVPEPKMMVRWCLLPSVTLPSPHITWKPPLPQRHKQCLGDVQSHPSHMCPGCQDEETLCTDLNAYYRKIRM